MSVTYFEMSCHVWALSANEAEGLDLNRRYEDLCGALFMEYLEGSEDLKTLMPKRRKIMHRIVDELAAKRNHYLFRDVYIVAGYFGSDLNPAHLWLEDYSVKVAFGTTTDQVIEKKRCPRAEDGFNPPGSRVTFERHNLCRIWLPGYTSDQVKSCGEIMRMD